MRWSFNTLQFRAEEEKKKGEEVVVEKEEKEGRRWRRRRRRTTPGVKRQSGEKGRSHFFPFSESKEKSESDESSPCR